MFGSRRLVIIVLACVVSLAFLPTTKAQEAATPEPGTPAPEAFVGQTYPPVIGDQVPIYSPNTPEITSTVTVDAVIDPFEEYDGSGPADDTHYVAVTTTSVSTSGVIIDPAFRPEADVVLGTTRGRLLRSVPVDLPADSPLRGSTGEAVAGVGFVATRFFEVPDDAHVTSVYYTGTNRRDDPGTELDDDLPYSPYDGYLTLLADLGDTPGPTMGTPVTVYDRDGNGVARVTITGYDDQFQGYGGNSGVKPGNRIVAVTVTVENLDPDDSFGLLPDYFFIQTAQGFLDDAYLVTFSQESGVSGLRGLGRGGVPGGGFAGGTITFMLPDDATVSGIFLRPDHGEADERGYVQLNVGVPMNAGTSNG